MIVSALCYISSLHVGGQKGLTQAVSNPAAKVFDEQKFYYPIVDDMVVGPHSCVERLEYDVWRYW